VLAPGQQTGQWSRTEYRKAAIKKTSHQTDNIAEGSKERFLMINWGWSLTVHVRNWISTSIAHKIHIPDIIREQRSKENFKSLDLFDLREGKDFLNKA
jgi:hypothetical protein